MPALVLWIGAGLLGAMMGVLLGAFTSGILYRTSPASWPKLVTAMLGVLAGTSAAPIAAAILGKPDTLGPYCAGLGLAGIICFLRSDRLNRSGTGDRDQAAKSTVAILLEIAGNRLDADTRTELLRIMLLPPGRFDELRQKAMSKLDERLGSLADVAGQAQQKNG